MDTFEKGALNQVKRAPKRGFYDKETIYKILDSSFVCHVGFVVDGRPFVIPTAYGRHGDRLYLHGATTSRMMLELEKGMPVCITVTHLDGIVLARSAFHHSMNYRSVVVFGTARLVEPEGKEEALYHLTEHILAGRWDEVRPPTSKELKGTTILSVKIETASAKIRQGPPVDDEPDYALPVWAGVVPVSNEFGTPQPDPLLKNGVLLSDSIKQLDGNRMG